MQAQIQPSRDDVAAPGRPGEAPSADRLATVAAGGEVPSEVHESLGREVPVLEIDRFNLWYGSKQALHRITMPVPLNKVTALVGPSGCGKSTLLRSVNRLNDLVPSVRITGDMRLSGDSIYDPRMDVIELRKRMGMVFQKPNPFPMSIYENVVYSLRIDGENARPVLDEVCELSLRGAALWDEVKDRLHDSALGLSGGQQQRLCIARAIAIEPEIILMDEPCSALDPIATAKIEQLIEELREHFTIVLVTHSIQQAGRVSQRTAYFHLGRLVEAGPTPEIFTNPRHPLTEAYLTGRIG